MTGTRSALLAFPLLLVLAIVMLIERKRVALAVIAASTAVGALVVALLAQWFSAERAATALTLVRHLLTGGTVSDETTLQRFAIYRAGVQAFWQSPIFGVGWHQKMEAIRPNLPPEYESLANLTHLHDEVLNFAVGMGIVGVLVYLALLVVPIAVCLKSPRDSQFRARLYGCTLLVGSYVTLGLADVMLSFELHTALYVVLTALLLSYCRDRPAARIAVDQTATFGGLEA
jgi:O-antigen ligase